MGKRKINLKKLFLRVIVIIFIGMNVVAYFHAYKFTHFSDSVISKTKTPAKLSTMGKLNALLFGINNPRPFNAALPVQPFETIKLNSNKIIECWYIKTAGAKGTVILFHGYGGEKSSLLNKSDEFIKLGYNTLLVDFMGSGGSEGNQTTIGYKEAEEVKTVFDYVIQKGENKIYLFGSSLGATAIMKAINDYTLNSAGIILECPFGSMYTTVCARFKNMQVPSFPMAGLLVFWGGVQNGFWAFGHNPVEYAKKIQCPVLLLYGAKDDKVSRAEIDEIYLNVSCRKQLNIYELAGHEDYLNLYREKWLTDVKTFMEP
jgi:uncharacterized protein